MPHASDSIKILDHCTRNKMKFLTGSYATIVHMAWDNYFQLAENEETGEYLQPKNTAFMDHMNLICTYNGHTILTSSPYMTLYEGMFPLITEYEYDIYAVNPLVMDYLEFAKTSYDKIREPLTDITYAFTDAPRIGITHINEKIWDDLNIYPTFIPLKVKEGEQP